MYETDVWVQQGWYPSKKNPANICKKVDRLVVTVFSKQELFGRIVFTAACGGQFTRTFPTQLEAQLASYGLAMKMAAEAPPKKEKPKPQRPETKREKAFRILELEVGASEQEIQSAFRRLLFICHPDTGNGSGLKTRNLIRARDFLISNSS